MGPMSTDEVVFLLFGGLLFWLCRIAPERGYLVHLIREAKSCASWNCEIVSGDGVRRALVDGRQRYLRSCPNSPLN